MDIFGNSTLRQACLETYGYLKTSNATDTTIWCTVAVPLLAFGLEFVANWRITCDVRKAKRDEEEAASPVNDSPSEASAVPEAETVSEQPQPQLEPRVELQPTSETVSSKDSDTKVEEKKPDPSCGSCCVDSSSTEVRANRLLAATFVFSLILIAFTLRIHEANTKPTISARCQPVIHPTPPNWAVIVVLVIFPFTCACLAFLRTLVDCVLVRWGSALTINGDTRDGRCFWVPCMPFFVGAVIVYWLLEAFKLPIAWLMGDREVSMWTKKSKKGKERAQDVEMQGEEAQRLVDNVDGPGEGDGEEPPAYDQVCSARVSVEGKRAVDV